MTLDRPAAAVGVVELERGLRDMDFGDTAQGTPYAEALLLLRLHGDPLATVTVELERGEISAARLAELAWPALEEPLRTHAEAQDCLPEIPAGADDLLGERAEPRSPCAPRLSAAADAPFVSVIVPTAGRPERVDTFVRALQKLGYPSFEIVVVDNSPDRPGTRQAVARISAQDERVRYVGERGPGSSVARNRGIREARSDLLAFTDDDVIVDPDWLSWLVEPFLRDPQVGVTTGLVMPARLDTPEQRFFEEYSGFGKGFAPRLYDLERHAAPEHLLYPYWGGVFGSGNSMAFRRAVIEGIGGFDPALGAGSPARAGADVEAFSHAILAGSRLAYEPRAVCWHDHRASSEALRRQTFSYGAGFTAILTKSVLREPRLALRMVAQLARTLRGGGDRTAGSSHELGRLREQFAMSRAQRALGVQLGGYLVGPLLYLRSSIWARRKRLHAVLRGGEVAA